MRLPRMTTRRWMIVVAVVSLLISGGLRLKQRRDYFLSLARSHAQKMPSSTAEGKALKSRFGSTSGMRGEEILFLRRDFDRMMDRADHHAGLVQKYHRAARYPWLPVEPDPPEPG
jgi:hypothetical protein